jgi:hypothetical protein
MAQRLIYQGIAVSLTCKAQRQNDAFDGVDLAGYTTITGCFPRSDGTTLTLTGSGGEITTTAASTGSFSITLNASATSVLKEGVIDFFVKYTLASGTEEGAIFTKQINVKNPKC